MCEQVLATVPEWFGIPEANADYAATAEREPTLVACLDSEPVGLLTIVQHTDSAAEVYLMAVVPTLHRRGVGTALLAEAERWLRERRVRFLQVKTLADTNPDPNYALTRAFYLTRDFTPLEVFPTLWDESNPALQLVKSL